MLNSKKTTLVKKTVKTDKAPLPGKVKRHKDTTIADSIKLEAEAKTILENIPESLNEQKFIKEYSFMLRLNSRLIRKLRRQLLSDVKLNNRDIYSLATLMSQQREVIADIRAISDLSGQVQMLLESALQPMISTIGQTVVNSFYQQRRLLIETSKEGETKFALQKLDEITKDVSKSLQVSYEHAAAKIQEILVGVPETPVKRKRKR